jgi:peptidoglycan/xylan/chitin deacetylase (PgdA/CDA1 family)
MTPLKTTLLSAYYYGSLPYRALQARVCSHLGLSPVMILFYHRVADTCPNDWTLSTQQFAEHIHWLQKHFDLISLREAQQRIRSGANHRAAVAITFDDGYAENSVTALPLLVRHQIPVTYFVSTENILEGKPFPHDVMAGIPLQPNTPNQLRALLSAGVDIGAHSRTHADIGSIRSHDLLVDEMITARDELEDAIGTSIKYFAFPYGQVQNMSSEAFALARQAGYEGVCSAYGGYNFPGDDGFHLSRIHGDPEMLRLKNWLTVDPRKLKIAREIIWPNVPASKGFALATSNADIAGEERETARVEVTP